MLIFSSSINWIELNFFRGLEILMGEILNEKCANSWKGVCRHTETNKILNKEQCKLYSCWIQICQRFFLSSVEICLNPLQNCSTWINIPIEIDDKSHSPDLKPLRIIQIISMKISTDLLDYFIRINIRIPYSRK